MTKYLVNLMIFLMNRITARGRLLLEEKHLPATLESSMATVRGPRAYVDAARSSSTSGVDTSSAAALPAAEKDRRDDEHAVTSHVWASEERASTTPLSESLGEVDSGRDIGVDGDAIDLHQLPPAVPQNDAVGADNGQIDPLVEAGGDALSATLSEAESKAGPLQPREIKKLTGATSALAFSEQHLPSAAIDDPGEIDHDALIALVLQKFAVPLPYAKYDWIEASTIAKVLGILRKAADGPVAESTDNGDAPHLVVHEERVEDLGSSWLRYGSGTSTAEDRSRTPRCATLPLVVKLRPTTASHLESLFRYSIASGNNTLVMTMAPLFTLIEAVLRTTEEDPTVRLEVLSSIRNALGFIAKLIQNPTSELRDEMLPHRWWNVVGLKQVRVSEATPHREEDEEEEEEEAAEDDSTLFAAALFGIIARRSLQSKLNSMAALCRELAQAAGAARSNAELMCLLTGVLRFDFKSCAESERRKDDVMCSKLHRCEVTTEGAPPDDELCNATSPSISDAAHKWSHNRFAVLLQSGSGDDDGDGGAAFQKVAQKSDRHGAKNANSGVVQLTNEEGNLLLHDRCFFAGCSLWRDRCFLAVLTWITLVGLTLFLNPRLHDTMGFVILAATVVYAVAVGIDLSSRARAAPAGGKAAAARSGVSNAQASYSNAAASSSPGCLDSLQWKNLLVRTLGLLGIFVALLIVLSQAISSSEPMALVVIVCALIGIFRVWWTVSAVSLGGACCAIRDVVSGGGWMWLVLLVTASLLRRVSASNNFPFDVTVAACILFSTAHGGRKLKQVLSSQETSSSHSVHNRTSSGLMLLGLDSAEIREYFTLKRFAEYCKGERLMIQCHIIS